MKEDMQYVVPFVGGPLNGHSIVWRSETYTSNCGEFGHYVTAYSGLAMIPLRYVFIPKGKKDFDRDSNFTETISKLTLPESFKGLDYGRQCKVYNQLQAFVNSAVTKYVKGQKEHGGRLEDRPCFDEMHNELLDLMWYWYAEKERRDKEVLDRS